MKKSANSFERSLLRDPDVKFGFDNYALLRTVSAFVQQLQEAGAHIDADGSRTLDSRVSIEGLDDGPSLLTLVRLAHSGGRRLVISLEDMADPLDSKVVVRI